MCGVQKISYNSFKVIIKWLYCYITSSIIWHISEWNRIFNESKNKLGLDVTHWELFAHLSMTGSCSGGAEKQEDMMTSVVWKFEHDGRLQKPNTDKSFIIKLPFPFDITGVKKCI